MRLSRPALPIPTASRLAVLGSGTATLRAGKTFRWSVPVMSANGTVEFASVEKALAVKSCS